MTDRIGSAIAGVAALLVAFGVDIGQGEVDQLTQAIVGIVGGVAVVYAIGKSWIAKVLGKINPPA